MLNLELDLTTAQWISIGTRILFAFIIGAVVGMEREKNNHLAGMRTHIIVCVASCLLMLLGLCWESVSPKIDASRVVQGTISGIGFLCAGTILRDGNKVRGLTTSASMWLIACLGLIIGAGMYAIASVATVLLLVVLIFIPKFEKKILVSLHRYKISIRSENLAIVSKIVEEKLNEYGEKAERINFDKESNKIEYILVLKRDQETRLVSELMKVENIDGINADVMD